MKTEHNCPKFEFNTFIDEFNNEKILFEASKAKLIFDERESYSLTSIKVLVLDDIEIEFKLHKKIINEYRMFTIEFESIDGWLINIENCIFTFFSNSYPLEAKGLHISITKGHYNEDSEIEYYKFIENLNLSAESKTNRISCTPLDNLFLIKHKDNIFKNIDGYVYTKSIYRILQEEEDVFKNLCFLIKYYSVDSASMRISYCVGDDFQKIEIGIPSIYSNFKYFSYFYDRYPNTFFNFLNSSYDSYVRLKNDGIIDVNLLIHYLTVLRRESNIEVELLISAIILEVLTKNHKKVKDSNEAKLRADLKELIKELDLNLNKLDEFFKEYGVSCEKNTFLSEIVKARHDIIHGNAVISLKINALMTTFVNIIVLRLFNINCAMYIPLIKENVFTEEFLNRFIINDEEQEDVQGSSGAIDDNEVKVVDINGELYLPLKIFDDLIKKEDTFRLIEFETKEYGEECKLNLKMSRLVKQ